MRILFLDIDGCVVKADIQSYVRQIELFGDEPIKDFEYIKKCIGFMLEKAKKENASEDEIHFIERVYDYISTNMFEMLKEYRDCFLEYDNLPSFEERKQYILDYQSNPIKSAHNEEIPMFMKYIVEALKYAKTLFECEYARVEREGGALRLPFKTVNEDNDFLNYDNNDDPLNRAKSALNRMEIYEVDRQNGQDDFLTACRIVGNMKIVNYDEIYVKENLISGVRESLKYLLDTNKVDMIVGCSHHTGYRETQAKLKLFQQELPFVVMLPESLVKFHVEPAQMGKRRKRSSKPLQMMRMKMRLSNQPIISGDYFVDDSTENLNAAVIAGVVSYLFRPRKQKEIEEGIDSPTDERFIRQFGWNIEEMERIFDIANKRGTTRQEEVKSYIKK